MQIVADFSEFLLKISLLDDSSICPDVDISEITEEFEPVKCTHFFVD